MYVQSNFILGGIIHVDYLKKIIVKNTPTRNWYII